VAPHEPEAYGLLAPMELNASGMAARTDAAGEPILLLNQNRTLWGQLQIRRALEQARKRGGEDGQFAITPEMGPAFVETLPVANSTALVR
jgi:predicted RNA polymerase sigma factor